MLIICVTTDYKYSKIPTFLQPFYIGFGLLAIGIAMGGNCGYGLNPVIRTNHISFFHSTDEHFSQARDLAPRLVSYLGGWGPGVFRYFAPSS